MSGVMLVVLKLLVQEIKWQGNLQNLIGCWCNAGVMLVVLNLYYLRGCLNKYQKSQLSRFISTALGFTPLCLCRMLHIIPVSPAGVQGCKLLKGFSCCKHYVLLPVEYN